MKRKRIVLSLIACLLLWAASSWSADLEIHVINVDQGDCFLIISPSGKRILVDAGDTGKGNAYVFPYLVGLGATSLDYLVASHYHEDHIGGIDEVVNALGGSSFITTAAFDRGGSYSTQAYTGYINSIGAKRTTIAPGMNIDIGGGAQIECVASNGYVQSGRVYSGTDENTLSVVFILKYNTFQMYFGGDSSSTVEPSIAPYAGDVDVYKVSHHGSSTSSSQSLLNYLKPEVSVIPVGDGNSYGHPSSTTVTRLVNNNSYIYQTETGSAPPPVGEGEVANGNFKIVTGGYFYTISGSSINSITRPTDDTGKVTAPFGAFDTPIAGSTVSGSIAVTGWALDDIEVKKVEVKRDPFAGDPPAAIGLDGLVYIGDAVMVRGARPDIEALYPDYPNSDRAGWGYMMLTYGLPNKGNGIFRIHAIAEDVNGNKTKLGIKQITSDNNHRVKPFGTLDTPSQGGTVSGTAYASFGWALTPLPNMIPTDGSTVWMVIDSVLVGHPIYNLYRADIANDFPEYLNADGAVGLFEIDTTKYANGVHTIGWLAYDNADNEDGMGSRFFDVLNPGGMPQGQFALSSRYIEDTSGILGIEVVGPRAITIEEMDRIEVVLKGQGGAHYTGWGDTKDKPLPIGSTLDTKSGVFYWMPAPGFLGTYNLHFAVNDGSRMSRPVEIVIQIVPKKYKRSTE